MNLFKIAIWFFILYYLYKFVFSFVVPVTKAAKQMKTKVEQVHQQQQQNNFNYQEKPKESSAAKKEDYIDFEEIKS